MEGQIPARIPLKIVEAGQARSSFYWPGAGGNDQKAVNGMKYAPNREVV
jgi:hypothetical protein